MRTYIIHRVEGSYEAQIDVSKNLFLLNLYQIVTKKFLGFIPYKKKEFLFHRAYTTQKAHGAGYIYIEIIDYEYMAYDAVEAYLSKR